MKDGHSSVRWNLTSDTRILVYSEEEIKVWGWKMPGHLGEEVFLLHHGTVSRKWGRIYTCGSCGLTTPSRRLLDISSNRTSVQLCPTLFNPMDCSPSGSSVHRVLQARILEWVAITSSRGSSQSRDRICISYVSCIAGRFFICWAIEEAPSAPRPGTNSGVNFMDVSTLSSNGSS